MINDIRYRIADHDDISRTLTRLAHEIHESNRGVKNLALVGIRTRGVPLANRLAGILSKIGGDCEIPVGILDITLYRDDFMTAGTVPQVHATEIGFDLHSRNLVLVDDVLFTGRTVRAAIDAILDYGRPARIQLAILVDRGHREMPIQGDFIGKTILTSPGEEVLVRLAEIDGVDEVVVVEKPTPKER